MARAGSRPQTETLRATHAGAGGLEAFQQHILHNWRRPSLM